MSGRARRVPLDTKILDPTTKIPYILHLSDITLADYRPAEEILGERLLEEAESASAPTLTYDKIPQFFTTVEEWSESTNLRCWTCDFTFDGPPRFIPTSIKETDAGYLIGVLGNMCCFACASLYIHVNYKREIERNRALDNLCFVYFLMTGKKIANIPPAIPKTQLCQYGGVMDEETFRTEMRKLDPTYGISAASNAVAIAKKNLPTYNLPVYERAKADYVAFLEFAATQTTRYTLDWEWERIRLLTILATRLKMISRGNMALIEFAEKMDHEASTLTNLLFSSVDPSDNPYVLGSTESKITLKQLGSHHTPTQMFLRAMRKR